MTDLDDFIREVQIRAVTEEKDAPPPGKYPVMTLADELSCMGNRDLGRAFRRAILDRQQPIARTMEVKGDAMTFIAEPDVAAFQAVFDDIDHD